MLFNRTRNTARNIFFGYINKIVTLLYPFIIRTLIIKKIGADFLGLSSLFSSVLQVLSLTELGFGSAVIFSMYKPIADNDEITLSAIINYLRKVYAYIGMTILVLGLVILPFIPYLIKGEVPGNINIFYLYVIYLLGSVVGYFLFAYKSSLLIAYQRNDVVSNINTAVFLITYTMQLFIIIFTRNYYLYAIANLINSVFINLSTAYFAKKLFPHIMCKGTVSKSLKNDIRIKVSGLLVSKISVVSRNAFDSIFLSVYLGLVSTAMYNNYIYISTAISGFIIIIFSSMTASVGNSVVTSSVERNYEDMMKFNFLYMWITGFCSICLLCLYQPFVEFCWGSEMLFPFHIVLLFCIYFYSLRINDILGLYYEANGFWWKGKYIYIAETVFNILFNAFFGKIWGVSGIVVATVVSITVTTNIFLPFITFRNYFKHINISNYFKCQSFYIISTFLVGCATYYICSLFSVTPIANILLRLLAVIIISNILYFIIYQRTKNYRSIKKWVLSKIRNKFFAV